MSSDSKKSLVSATAKQTSSQKSSSRGLGIIHDHSKSSLGQKKECLVRLVTPNAMRRIARHNNIPYTTTALRKLVKRDAKNFIKDILKRAIFTMCNKNNSKLTCSHITMAARGCGTVIYGDRQYMADKKRHTNETKSAEVSN